MKKIVQILLFAAAAAVGSLSALAGGSSPGLYYGQVPTAAQWNSYFAAKLDYTPGAANAIPYWDGSGSQLNALVSGDCTAAANVFTCTHATNANNIVGGTQWGVLYQSASGVTASTAAGTAGFVLTSNATSAPTFQSIGAPFASAIHAATSKTIPVGADEFGIWDSVSGLLNKVTFTNALNYFAPTAGNSAQTFSVAAASAPANAVRLDQMTAPYRNRLINGDMMVSQLNAASAVTPTTTDTYPIDQWKTDTTQASKLTFQQVVDAPPGFKYSEKVTVAAQFAPGATDRFAIYQPVEGQNIIDFGLGTATPSTLAASLWLKCSTAGTYAVGINNAGTRSYIGTVSCTTSWAKQTVVLVGDNTGTWNTDNTIGAQFYVDLGSGSNFNTTAGAWQAGDFTRTTGTATFVNLAAGQTFQMTGAQFEQVPAGANQGSPFEYIAYDTQLRRSLRYLPCWNSTGTASTFSASAYTNSTANAIAILQFFVPTRISPTGAVGTSITTPSQVTFANSTAYVASAFGGFNGSSVTEASLSFTITGGTANQGGSFIFNNAVGQICLTGAQM